MIGKKMIAVLLSMLLLLSGCSPQITKGEVYDKEYREAYSTITVIPMSISNGKFVSVYSIPYVIRYPDRYVIFIKAYKEGKWITEDFYVSEDVYNVVNIGDMFVYDKERGDLCDEPYTKERED